MISSSWEKFSLLASSSHAAVTDTTSGLMLFSCSSNCSLNRMASSLTFSCFTVDICQERRGRDAGMRRFSTDESVFWEYWRDFFFLIYYAFSGAKQSCLCRWFSVSNKYLQRSHLLQFRCFFTATTFSAVVSVTQVSWHVKTNWFLKNPFLGGGGTLYL